MPRHRHQVRCGPGRFSSGRTNLRIDLDGCRGQRGTRCADGSINTRGMPASPGCIPNRLTSRKPSTRSYHSALASISRTVSPTWRARSKLAMALLHPSTSVWRGGVRSADTGWSLSGQVVAPDGHRLVNLIPEIHPGCPQDMPSGPHPRSGGGIEGRRGVVAAAPKGTVLVESVVRKITRQAWNIRLEPHAGRRSVARERSRGLRVGFARLEDGPQRGPISPSEGNG